MALLSAQHLQKKFKQNSIVKDVSLSVRSGEIVGLLGPNGAGKTTCFYMIVGLVPCDQGHVFLDNCELTHMPMDKRARLGVGYLPQEPSVFRKLSVYENIFAILELRQDLTPAQRKEKAQELLAEFHIEHIAGSLGQSLSGGERRRVEIARALAANPQFVLLDEPFAGVDPISIIDIKEIIRHLVSKDIGILITDHNVRETLDICGSAYIMGRGELIAQGTPQEVLNHPQVRRVYLGEDFVL